MTTAHPLPEQHDDITIYEQALRAQMGAAELARYRTDIATSTPFGDARTALKVGDAAPPFALADLSGTICSLTELYQHGPVVAIFYRGGWCPFCNIQLRAFQLARMRLRALRASVVLISPQRMVLAQSVAERHALQFPVLTDVGNQVARQYGLVFALDAEQRDEYRADDTDLADINDDARWELPMPATFVIDRLGSIRYAFVSADYTRRAEPSDVLAVLHELARR